MIRILVQIGSKLHQDMGPFRIILGDSVYDCVPGPEVVCENDCVLYDCSAVIRGREEEHEKKLKQILEGLYKQAHRVLEQVETELYCDYLPFIGTDYAANVSCKAEGLLQDILSGCLEKFVSWDSVINRLLENPKFVEKLEPILKKKVDDFNERRRLGY